MARVFEIRVHGVSGTPPETTLDLYASLIDSEAQDVLEFEPPRSLPVRTVAYSWGGLTSGRWTHALWLLLAPFVLSNVAGWALLPPKPAGQVHRLQVALIRLAGLILTGMAAGIMFLLVVDLTAWQWLVRIKHVPMARAGPLGMLLAITLLVFLWTVTKVRTRPATQDYGLPPDTHERPWGDCTDPAGSGRLEVWQRDMWDHPGVILRLRNMHLGFGLSVLGALAIGSTRPTDTAGVLAELVAWTAALGMAVCVALLPGQGVNVPILLDFASRSAFFLGALVAVVGSAKLRNLDSVATADTGLDDLRGSLIIGGCMYLVIVLVCWLWQLVSRLPPSPYGALPRRMSATAPALLMIAVGVIVMVGLAGAVLVARWLGGGHCTTDPSTCPIYVGQLVDWLAYSNLAILSVLLIAASVSFLVVLGCTDVRLGSRSMQAVKRLLTGPARVMAWLGGVSAVAALLVVLGGILRLSGRLPFDAPEHVPFLISLVFAASIYLIPAVALLIVVGRKATVALLSLAAIGTIGSVLLLTEWQLTIGGVPLLPQSLRDVYLGVGILGPTVLLATRMVAGIRKRKVRRGVGVLWDLALFWPRWFHPFCPPTYSDRAVTLLAERMSKTVEKGSLILSGHSQGSVIGAAAILLIAQTEPHKANRIGFVTHGSPIGRLYFELFPAVFDREFLDVLVKALTNEADGARGVIRWRNLHRATDPVGGPIRTEKQGWLSTVNDTVYLEFEAPVIPDDAQPGADPQWDRVLGGRDLNNRIHSVYSREPGYPFARGEVQPAP